VTKTLKTVSVVDVDLLAPSADFRVYAKDDAAANKFIHTAVEIGYVVHDHSRSDRDFDRIIYPMNRVVRFIVTDNVSLELDDDIAILGEESTSTSTREKEGDS
jgi:hypothetical protein